MRLMLVPSQPKYNHNSERSTSRAVRRNDSDWAARDKEEVGTLSRVSSEALGEFDGSDDDDDGVGVFGSTIEHGMIPIP